MPNDIWEYTSFLSDAPEGYYWHQYWCGNCNERTFVIIQKGTRADNIKVPCRECGCEVAHNSRKFTLRDAGHAE